MMGERIRNARIKEGLTQKDVAKQIGVSPRRISQFESGHRTPSSMQLLQLAKECKVRTEYYFRCPVELIEIHWCTGESDD